jgi:hypothetical protein
VGPVKPSVGRVVHYVSYGTPRGEFASQCRAAIVAEVLSDTVVAVCVLNPTGIFFNDAAQDETDHMGGTWHWPERVEG